MGGPNHQRSRATEKNLMPEPIEKEMNRYTYVADPTKTTKKVYMLKLDQGYEI